MIFRLTLLALAAAALPSAALAQGTAKPLPVPMASSEAGPRWAALTASQQTALRPLQAEWASIDADRKSKWLAVAARFPTMAPTDQQRLQDRMAEWARLTPAERGRARQNYQALRNVRPEERQALWDAYRQLPPEARTELAQRPSAAARPVPPADAKVQAAGKRNLVPPSTQQVAGKTATPTMIQARPGATTTLVTKPGAPPAHSQPGLPKIAATQGFVNPSTLLPRRGPQGAAAAAPAASSSVHDAAQ